MDAAFEARNLASANRLIRKYGALVPYSQWSSEPGDAPWFPADAAATTYNVPMLSANEGVVRYFKFQVKKEDMPEGTLQLLMPGDVPFRPQYRDAFAWPDGDNALWYVKNFDAVAPGGNTLLYFIEATK